MPDYGWGTLTIVLFFVLGACGSGFYLVIKHKRYFRVPVLQRKVICIAWMPPIYSASSWLSLVYPGASLYLNMMRDCYEAYVVYLFFALCVAFIGLDEYGVQDDSKVLLALQNRRSIHHLFPVNLIYDDWDLQREPHKFLLQCKKNILQFVVFKPLTALIAIALELGGCYDEGTISLTRGYAYIAFIQNFSVSLSLYYLALFYVATRDVLRPFSPVPKFFCVKSVLFVTFWQSVFLAILCYLHWMEGYGESTRVQNLMICFEMFVAAIFHHHAFPVSEYLTMFCPDDDFEMDERIVEENRSARLLARQNSEQTGSSSRGGRARLDEILPWGGTGLREDFNEVSPIVISGGNFRPHVVQRDDKLYVPPPFEKDEKKEEPVIDRSAGQM